MFHTLGGWVHRRRRLVLLAWAVLFAVGIVVGSAVFSNLKDSNGGSSSPSVQGFKILDDASNKGPSMVAVIDGKPVDDPATRAAVERASRSVSELPGVISVANAYNSTDTLLRAKDGTASLIVVTVRKTDDPMTVHDDVEHVRGVLHDAVPGAAVNARR